MFDSLFSGLSYALCVQLGMSGGQKKFTVHLNAK